MTSREGRQVPGYGQVASPRAPSHPCAPGLRLFLNVDYQRGDQLLVRSSLLSHWSRKSSPFVM